MIARIFDLEPNQASHFGPLYVEDKLIAEEVKGLSQVSDALSKAGYEMLGEWASDDYGVYAWNVEQA